MSEQKRVRERRRLMPFSIMLSREILQTLRRDRILSEFQEQIPLTNGSYVTIPIWSFVDRMWNTPPPWTLPSAAQPEATRIRQSAVERIQDDELETVCEHVESVLVDRVSVTDLVKKSDLLDRLAEAFGPNFRVSWERNEAIHDEDEYTLYSAHIALHFYPNGRPQWYKDHLASTPVTPISNSFEVEMHIRGRYGPYMYRAPMTPPLRARTSTAPPPLVRPSLRSCAVPDDIEPRCLFTDKNCVSPT